MREDAFVSLFIFVQICEWVFKQPTLHELDGSGDGQNVCSSSARSNGDTLK